MAHERNRLVGLLVFVSLVAPVLGGVADEPARWLGPDGVTLPFQTDAEIIEFLRTARVESREKVKEGINGVQKVLLERDGVRVHAVFRDVRIRKSRQKLNGRLIVGFRDDCIFEVAAYRLSRLLSLDRVPPVVMRRIDGKKGTLQIWVEEAFSEKERLRNKLPVQGSGPLLYQFQTLYLFDNLIYNYDRNQGNILYDRAGRMWLIDHTRAFQAYGGAPYLSRVSLCSRKLFGALKSLDRKRLDSELSGILTGSQINAVWRRVEEVAGHLQELVEERGEKQVLF